MTNSNGQFTGWCSVSNTLKSEPIHHISPGRASKDQRWQVHTGLVHGLCPPVATLSYVHRKIYIFSSAPRPTGTVLSPILEHWSVQVLEREGLHCVTKCIMDELRTLWPNNMLLVDTLYFLIVLMYETYFIHAKVLDLKINQEFREMCKWARVDNSIGYSVPGIVSSFKYI